MNIVITTGELEQTDNNTLNYRKVRVIQTMLRCKGVLVIGLNELFGNPTN
jgi:hypothetical protein